MIIDYRKFCTLHYCNYCLMLSREYAKILTVSQNHLLPPLRVDISYGLSTLGTSAIGFITTSWLLYFYLPPDGPSLVPVALFGTAIFISRFISALFTPYIGYLSDNSQSRWGRRLPFMLVSSLPFVGAFIFLWTPPTSRESLVNLLYLGGMAIVFRLASAFYHVPYQALLPEIASTERHRVRISAWQSSFLLLGMMLGGLAGWVIEKRSFLFTMLVFAAFVYPLLILPLRFLREDPHRQVQKMERFGFWKNLSIAIRNKAFMTFATVWGVYLMTTTLVQSSVPFIVTEVCQLRESETIYFYIPAVLASLACYPIVTMLANRWGKWKLYSGSLLFSAIIFPGTMILGGWMMVSLKVQCISWAVLQAIAISGVVVLSTAFIAEITDVDESATGQRREGVYFAVMKVLDQLFSGVALVILPVILLLGRSSQAPMGPLGVRMTGVVAGVLMLVGFLIFLRYPNRQR